VALLGHVLGLKHFLTIWIFVESIFNCSDRGSRYMHYDDCGVGLRLALDCGPPSAIVGIVQIVESVSMTTIGAVFNQPWDAC
jgi:hypothetical protein